MLKKWLYLKKTAALLPEDTDNLLFKQLFSFLISRISTPGNAEQLIQLGNRSAVQGAEESIHTYLLFEKYLTSFEQGTGYTRHSLRASIRERFPAIVQEPVFSILFVPEVEQKNTLAAEFINSFLDNVSSKFGRASDGYFEKKLKQLATLEGLKQEEVFKKLQLISFEAFEFVGKTYGEMLAGKIFEKTYESFSARYKEFESFPHLVTLIPKEIVSREHLGIFTQSQIEQIFLEKLAESEQLNIALDHKIRENEITQKLLEKNEIMLSSVISSALDAIVVINQEGAIIQWNQSATDIFGYTEDEVRGALFTETIIPPSYRQEWTSGLDRFLSHGTSPMLNKRVELTGIRKNSVEFPMELSVTAIRHEDEYYFNSFIRDISPRKRREKELVRMKEKAEQAAKAKSQFLSIMSHELRTPLNAVIGITHLLLQNNPREDQQEDLRTLQFSGESLLQIINDILDFNKLDSGKIEISAIDFNLRELVQSLYQSFSYKAKEKNVVFDVEYDQQMPFMVKGDNFRLSQVLNNLISNAIKFTRQGRVTLKVQLEKHDDQTYLTRFSVVDTGIGIPEDKKDKIFEQFTQANSDTTRLYGGTGLGLSISSKLVELMGSVIKVDSELGRGSSFYFSLMLHKATKIETSTPAQKPFIRDPHSLKDKYILLAEDNPFNANIARRFIESWGARMDLVLDGQQALEFALRKKYDLILMDVQMPVLDGFSCSKAIRKHLPDIPIIIVTASPKNEIMEKIISSGINGFVSKPFKPNELQSKIQQFLDP